MPAKNLVIVESPAKAKTITGYLGKDFVVKSSYGHIRDLPSKGMSIDIENDFAPEYVVSAGKTKTVAELRKAAKSAETVWLASDEDREGEAIAWHLAQALKLDPKTTKRIVFHEITKGAIEEAVKNPRTIDQQLVDAQQARRVLDRLVGYELSPVLWKKIRKGLSAGRVQSVAVRLVVEREREIEAFETASSFKLLAEFNLDDGSILPAEADAKLPYEDARKFIEHAKSATFTVENIEKKPGSKNPGAPFITSTLQQTASTVLGFSPKRTMQLAQRLYEAGKITYMRTDSTNLSKQAISQASELIKSRFGENYLQIRIFKTKSKGAQEAHEAIRPTNLATESAGDDNDQEKLYRLIWQRTMASQMASAKVENTNITIGLSERTEKLMAKGQIVTFDGFLAVQDKRTDDIILPEVKQGQKLSLESLMAKEVFDRPPARFTEASLVKKLEELGIGRPSTYAPTISTIQDRGYIERGDSEGTERNVRIVKLADNTISEETETEKTGSTKGKLVPTSAADVVTDFLVKHFNEVIDYDFTAQLEEELDDIADGDKKWVQVIRQFYDKFHADVVKGEDIKRMEAAQARLVGNDPKSGKPIYARFGRFGPMLQRGETESEEKPDFAKLPAGEKIETIKMEVALKAFELPKVLGESNGIEIKANIGRFGPYVQEDKLYASVPKDEDIHDITLERALELIAAKKEAAAQAQIKIFEEEGIKVLKGRFGPYITDGKTNATIPKTEEAADITLERAKELLTAKKTSKGKRRTPRKAKKK